MQVAVWVILFASVFPQRKTQHRRGEQEGEENKTENEKIQRASIAESDEEAISVSPCFAKNDITKRDGQGHKTKQHSRKQRNTKSIKCTKGRARSDNNFRWEGRRGDAKDAKRWKKT